MEKHLHIIAFNVPYPTNYGGAYDLFYKLSALHNAGVLIHLHCFDYGRGPQDNLNQYCYSVDYYQREMGHKAFSLKLPYIVSSRISEPLLLNLLKDNYPILMEGVHCSYPLLDNRFKDRKCFVRLHNVEYQYYRDLTSTSNSFLKKLYYWNESRLLHKYEAAIAKLASFWGVTKQDNAVYQQEFGCTAIDLLPLYLPEWEQQSLEGMGNFCLYHGDLSIDANQKAAIWLLEEVFQKIKIPLVIAGKNPSKKLEELAHQQSHTCLVANPPEKEMQDLIQKAHINVLPAFIKTGMKVKLINALFHGRHCIVNDAMVEGTGLAAACYTGTTANAFQELISQLYHQPFTSTEIEGRKRLLSGMFNNQENAQKQIQWIWGA